MSFGAPPTPSAHYNMKMPGAAVTAWKPGLEMHIRLQDTAITCSRAEQTMSAARQGGGDEPNPQARL